MTTSSNTGEIVNQKETNEIASILYGKARDSAKETKKVIIEAPNFICLENGQLLELKTNFPRARGTSYVLKKSIDFAPHEDFSPLSFDSDKINGPRVCLFFGHHSYDGINEKKKFEVYLNFITDQIVVDEKDVLFLYLNNGETSFTADISKNKQKPGESKPIQYEKGKVFSKLCRDKTEKSAIKFDLTSQKFKVINKGDFHMAFVNRNDVNSKTTAKASEDPSFKCFGNGLIVTYSSQIDANMLLVV